MQLDLWAGAGLRKNRLMKKHYHLFSLVMALMHAQDELAALRDDLGRPKPLLPDHKVLAGLQKLEDAARRKVTNGIYARFWKASSEKTNVRQNRLTRSEYFYRALTG